MNTTYTLHEYISGVAQGSINPNQVIDAYTSRAQANECNAWMRIHEEYVTHHSADLQKRPLKAAPLGIKDNILTSGFETTFGSKMGQGFVPAYNAHCFDLLEQAGGCMIGKCSMDEFAMGGSNETAHTGPVHNPHDHTRVSGGSSGGSAAAVANHECMAALGTDTGGSVRQPAALCGVVGAKPTYGRVSRYGVQSMASSLDQVGVLTQTVEDAKIMLDVVLGYDARDATSELQADQPIDAMGADDGVAGLHIALPKQYLSEGIDQDVKTSILQTIEQLRSQGAVIEEVDMPLLSYVIPAYYILMPAEVSSNLSRFDGLKFGHQDDTSEFDTIYDYYATVRDEGLGSEVKRRILTGAHVLSAGFYDSYYGQAKRFQHVLRKHLNTLYTNYDAIIGPTSPCPAWKIGEKTKDPIANYLADIYTVTANLAGLPAISVPSTPVLRDGVSLPVGFQIMTAAWDEAMMMRIASQVQI